MKHHKSVFFISCMAVFALLIAGCGDKNAQAKVLLENAQTAFESGNYEQAKQNLDSLNFNYPKAVEQRKEGMVLLQEIRRAMNDRQIKQCDSLLAIYSPQLEEMKTFFVLQQNKEYQDKGTYVPKGDPALSGFSTGLRSGVAEDGTMYVESVFLGGQQHNKLKVMTKDFFAETLEETGDGLNYRFDDNGRYYEIIRFMPNKENGIIRFIGDTDEKITVQLMGKATSSYTLSAASKQSIAKSQQLSELIQKNDSLQNAKFKALTLNDYLDEKKEAASSLSPVVQ
ncbi:hypothetical protein M2132_000460 [Dysgonomonas sp. PH5-45]|uniref:hypothetical protein n=1 Tax=unclassified Dysgonomonas TaxID=2630389 RepID=UPI002474F744|nr:MULTISPECIES: hypothetical protein [unclassified Dysgonomonas]MDH6354138.1 hypothetical protein [Dysgonomonas sp. PH5-45]MDH6387011.1 hypothetical protein [Dysgonomonas sp. PH5-37]